MQSLAGPWSSRQHHQRKKVIKWASCTDELLFFFWDTNRLGEVEDTKKKQCAWTPASNTYWHSREKRNQYWLTLYPGSIGYIQPWRRKKGRDELHSMKNVRQQSDTCWRSTLMPLYSFLTSLNAQWCSFNAWLWPFSAHSSEKQNLTVHL